MDQSHVITIERINKELEVLCKDLLPNHPLEWVALKRCMNAREQLGTLDTKTLFKALSQGKLEEGEPEKPCVSCDGRGSIDGTPCQICFGTGKVPNPLPGFENATNSITQASAPSQSFNAEPDASIHVTEFVDFREGQSTDDPKCGIYVDYRNGEEADDIPVVLSCSDRGNTPQNAAINLLRKMNAISATARTVEEILASIDGANFPDTLALHRLKKAVEYDTFEISPETIQAYLGGGETIGDTSTQTLPEKTTRHRRTKAEIEADKAAGK